MTTATNLPVGEGHTFHKRLSRNTRMTSSEAAPNKINNPTKRTNSPGLPANSTMRSVTSVFERDSGSNSERKCVEMALATMITVERMSAASRSEDSLPGLRLRSRGFSPHRNRKSSKAIAIASGAITAR